jgi:hypothetical protein
MAYNRGIRVLENPTSLTAPQLCTSGLQVIVGTAPVNLAEKPYSAAGVPKIAYSFSEASAAVGYSDDFKKYTLPQSIDATFRKFAVAPVILINVLDPAKHKKDMPEEEYPVKNCQVVVKKEGLLLDKLSVKVKTAEAEETPETEDEQENGTETEQEGETDTEIGTTGAKTGTETELTVNVDYITEFDSNGYAVITLLESGRAAAAEALIVSGEQIDPSMVTAGDIIGGYDVATGKESGLELVRQVYPLYGMVPGLISAPGFSRDAAVAAVMAAKCHNINGVFSCECIVDLDCTADGAVKYSDVKAAKEKAGLVDSHLLAVWPKVRIGDSVYYYSAVFSALAASVDAANDNVPSLHPSNKSLPITGLCMDDETDTEIVMDQMQANAVAGTGVVTAVKAGGFRSWGNNTAAYPATSDPKDRWFGCRRFFSWWGNSFIQTYFQKVDDPMDDRLIEAICDAENIRGNSYTAQGKCAGARITYSRDENPVTDIMDGKVRFHQYLAPFTPAEDILNVLEFDPAMLEAALGGE